MKIFIAVSLMIYSNLAIAQSIFTINGFSKEYYGKIEIKDTSKKSGEDYFSGTGYVAIFDSKTNRELIKVACDTDELFLELHNGKAIANIAELPYGEQSLIIYDDFNFDGIKDFAIEDGQNSCYHGPSFKIYLGTMNGFIYNKDFTRLAQEYCGMFNADTKEKKIFVMTKDGCCWHEYSEFIVEDNKPKAIKIVTDDETNSPYDIHKEETWNGKAMVKDSVKTISLSVEDVKVILSFNIPKNGKKVLLFNINDRTLNYALIQKDSTVEFSYPIETVFKSSDFKVDVKTLNRSVIFSNKNAIYRIYEKPNEIGIEISIGGKTYNWIGDLKSKIGDLGILQKVQLDNVIYK